MSKHEQYNSVNNARPHTNLPDTSGRLTRSQSVEFIIAQPNGTDGNGENAGVHPLFCEMTELKQGEWVETGRWVKYEELVEASGCRWSKPHVATLGFNSLAELHRAICGGQVLLDVPCNNFEELALMVVQAWVDSGQLPAVRRDEVVELLCRRPKHLFELKKQMRGLNTLKRMKHGHGSKADMRGSESDLSRRPASGYGSSASLQGMYRQQSSNSSGNLNQSLSHDSSQLGASVPRDLGNNLECGVEPRKEKYDTHFQRKLSPDTESANIMIATVDFLDDNYLNEQRAKQGEKMDGSDLFTSTVAPLCAFVRLASSCTFVSTYVSEVKLNSRFFFVALAPANEGLRLHELGRSMGTVYNDEIFRDVAYKTNTKIDLLGGIGEFLNNVTVLPPGEWDPKIRLEPPQKVPSQEPRRVGSVITLTSLGDDEGEGHGSDPALMRTGYIFGGLVADVRRRLPHVISDFTDALHPQCIASFIFLFLASLTPTITFGGIMSIKLDRWMGTMESLLAGCLSMVIYGLFSGQPLTLIGSTGPVLVFESVVYGLLKNMGYGDAYMPVRFWMGMWVTLLLFLIVIFDLSYSVKYITRFTEESFAALISIIFIVEAFNQLYHVTIHYPPELRTTYKAHGNDAALSQACFCVLNDGSFVSATTLSTMPTTTLSSFGVNSNISNTSGLVTGSGHIIALISKMLNSGGGNGGDAATLAATMHSNSSNVTLSALELYCAGRGGKLEGGACPREGGAHGFVPDVFFFSVVLFMLTFLISYLLKGIKETGFLPNKIRSLICDFAVIIGIFLCVGIDLLIGIDTPKLTVPSKVKPTRDDRDWVINPFGGNMPFYFIFVSIFPGIFATILIFMDQQITAVIVNRKDNKLKKGAGYHLDLLILAVYIAIASILGLPWFVATTVPSVVHVNSLKKESETAAPGEKPSFLGCREQRVTQTLIGIMIGLSVFLGMVFKLIPMPVLYGVFLFMGITSLKGLQVVDRILLLFMPQKYQPDSMYLRHVNLWRVHIFTLIQIAVFAIMYIIKEIPITSMFFPILLVVLCVVRKLMEFFFSEEELKHLDDIIPEDHKRAKEDREKGKRSRMGQEAEISHMRMPQINEGKPHLYGNGRESSYEEGYPRLTSAKEAIELHSQNMGIERKNVQFVSAAAQTEFTEKNVTSPVSAAPAQVTLSPQSADACPDIVRLCLKDVRYGKEP